MKITIIHGQNHKGSTYHIAALLAEKIGGEVTEFFLPKDFGDFCVGCSQCFMRDENLCPHREKLLPIIKAMDEADVLIFASPVYVYHVTGAMKAFLDHFGYRWLIHRPEGSMFTKQAVAISTAAGAGTRSTNKDMQDSFFFWGVGKTYSYGKIVHAAGWNNVTDKTKSEIDRDLTKLAVKIKRNYQYVQPSLKVKGMFYVMRMLHQKPDWIEPDRTYWEARGWNKKVRPWK